jgi:hypothetical protein
LKDPKYFGLGWTYPREYNHVDNKLGAWSEGEKSTLLFRSNGDDKFAMTFFYDANIIKKNYEFSIDIQNITKHLNVFQQYYDNYSQEIKTDYQLIFFILPQYKILF